MIHERPFANRLALPATGQPLNRLTVPACGVYAFTDKGSRHMQTIGARQIKTDTMRASQVLDVRAEVL